MVIFKSINPFTFLFALIKFKCDRLRLRKRISSGLKIGKNVYIMEEVDFDCTYPYLIEIGNNCSISKGVRILAHDATTFRDLGITKIAPVRILDGTFIGERAIILPGVSLGPNAMISAGSVVNRDIGENKIAAGNPARQYGNFLDLLENNIKKVKSNNVLNIKECTPRKIVSIINNNKICFVSGVPDNDKFYVNRNMKAINSNAKKAYNELRRKII